MKALEPALLKAFYQRYESASNRNRKGEVIQEFCELLSISRPTGYKLLRQMKTEENPFVVADRNRVRGKARKTKEQLEIEIQDAKEIAAFKQIHSSKKPISTELAVHTLLKQHRISREYSRREADRLLMTHGLTTKHFTNQANAVKLSALYPNHVFLADASPLEQHFMPVGETKLVHLDLATNDKHRDDILAKDKLRKVWIYMIVDLFSKAYYLMAFAGEPVLATSKVLGENLTDWLTAFKAALLPKRPIIIDGVGHAIPMQGVPENIYTDKFSGLTTIAGIFSRLHCHVSHHEPGNPGAKGVVERRIGAFKSFERLLDRSLIKNFEQLQGFLHQWMVYDNYSKGFYQRYLEGTKNHALRTITEQDWKNVTIAKDSRVVDKYGCISVGNKSFRLSGGEVLQGTKVNIFTDIDGKIVAYDQKENPYDVLESGPITAVFGSYAKHKESQLAKNRKQIKGIKSSLKQELLLESILPDAQNVTSLPVANLKPLSTKTRIAPEFFTSSEDALHFIEEHSFLTEADRIFLENQFQEAITALGKIHSSYLYEIIKTINEANISHSEAENE